MSILRVKVLDTRNCVISVLPQAMWSILMNTVSRVFRCVHFMNDMYFCIIKRLQASFIVVASSHEFLLVEG